jgi:hypothetical protein
MKIFLGNYNDYIGPYQLAQKLLFWKDKNSSQVNDLGHFLKHGYILSEEEKREEDERNFSSFFTFIDFLENENKKPSTKLNDFCEWVYSKLKRIEFVHIDKYDTWNMDHSLAKIIHPMLLKLKETKQGSPNVDLEDVPEYLRPSDSQYNYYEEGKLDVYFHDRWDYVVDTMIYAFNAISKQLDEGDDYYEPETIKEGLRLFGKYYQDLWT